MKRIKILFAFLSISSLGMAQQQITFKCDAVTPATEQLPIVSSELVIGEYTNRKIESFRTESQALRLVKSDFHPFVFALHMAYAEHRPVAISPDMIWMLIAQGLATHIEQNSDSLRSMLVKHADKKKLSIDTNLYGNFTKGRLDNPWYKLTKVFSDSIRANSTAQVQEDIVKKFSTTRPEITTAYEITLMSAMQNYFDYEAITSCGITAITLEGSTKDWKDLMGACEELEKYKLDTWVKSLKPILRQFVNASKGKIDLDFWQRIYKVRGGSGGPYVSGWIIKFFPYVGSHQLQPNPYLEREPETIFEGVTTRQFTSGISLAPFVWLYHREQFDMEFGGGFLGIKQDPVTLTLRPEIGWYVSETPKGNKQNRSNDK